MHALGDSAEAFGTVPDRVHARHHRQQHLRGADVARGFFAADVLLASLNRQAIRRVSLRIARDADDAARHLAGEFRLGRDVRRVRAAETHRHAEPLRRADGDVRAPFARRFHKDQREDVGGEDDHCASVVSGFDCVGVIDQPAVGGRVLDENAAERFQI